MNQSTQKTLMASLKNAIQEQHARMEALPFIVALAGGQLPLESYVAQLRAMAAIHGTLEHELGLAASGDIRNLLLDKPSRLVHLRKDLSVFDRQFIPDIAAALDHTREITAWIRRCRVEQPDDLLGILYVLQGNTLGNAVHLPDVLRIFGDQTDGTAHYYAGYGLQTARYWKAFGDAMNALAVDQEGRRRIVQAAIDFFGMLEALFSAFYPIENAKMVYTATMLNPEAGDHAVPGDVREIRAAVAAAKNCREEFPYFNERYQERGRGFAKSDAAWLATLAELPEAQLLSQVEWLGRVLGNRGMPRITLERQLELLYAELAVEVPEKTDRYQGLPEAARSLKKERMQLIPEPSFSNLAQAFHEATDSELQGRFNRTGDMIVSAVCDEAAGVTDAVASLLPWLTDAKRFSPQWIVAVSTTLEKAHEIIKGKQIL